MNKREKYTAGIDFGTLSARAVVADTADGTIYGEAVLEYPHAVITDNLPEGFALQDPNDYIEALKVVLRQAAEDAGISMSDIKGVGVDFTSCTLFPVDEDMTPLCFKEEFKDEPHAMVKLWKHNSTVSEAEEINAYAKSSGDEWLKYYGGKMTAEMGLPKILEVRNRAPRVYEAAFRFIEAGDYVSYLLTGSEVHSACFSDFKYAHSRNGFPKGEFYRPICEKLSDDIKYVSEPAGTVGSSGAELTGLSEGTAVSLSMIDCHASLPALNVTHAGDFLMVLGTSGCHMAHMEKLVPVKGICGCTYDAVMPRLATYEAGQSAVGDVFDWFVKNDVPGWCYDEAGKEGKNIHEWLSEKASVLTPGETGLVGVEWLLGNRSILSDSSRRGVMTGISIRTRPWEVYRAWLEAVAFGTKVIVDNYEENGIMIRQLKATGGISVKNPLFMQILADVLGKEIKVADVAQSAALGSAIYAASAAGVYEDVYKASDRMSCKEYITYTPVEESVRAYAKIYQRYRKLYGFFGNRDND
ncbi:MAG: ribulokinase [Lachnospiraceae bacterium]|nr:ribulokinase [Lachnospiraceae bacterium]